MKRRKNASRLEPALVRQRRRRKNIPALAAANADSRVPPISDTGSMPVFKYPFAFANKRVYQGGWYNWRA